MKSKSFKVLRTFFLLTIAVSILAMANSVYGYLGKSIPFFEANTQSRTLPAPVPVISEPEEVIPNDREVLKKVYQKAAELNSLSSLLVQKKGTLVIEDYFGDMRADQAVNIKSVSKSIMSLMAGIALERGVLRSIDQPIREFFPEYLNGSVDARKKEINIRDLLTMRAGLETTSFENYSRWVSSNDWVRFALQRPLVEEPGGEKMVYSTGSSHLLSVILTRASGMSTRAFAQKYLFDPMDIELHYWSRDPQGYYLGGNNMYLKPSDMIKIGRMILNGGKFNGKQIVPEKWLLDSFKTYTQSNNNSSRYGYMWWKQNIGGYQAVFACGYGGQYIFMFPELESVVAITSHLEYASDLRRYHKPVLNFMETTVIPQILEDGPEPERVSPGTGNPGTAIAR